MQQKIVCTQDTQVDYQKSWGLHILLAGVLQKMRKSDDDWLQCHKGPDKEIL